VFNNLATISGGGMYVNTTLPFSKNLIEGIYFLSNNAVSVKGCGLFILVN
jgi:hypothetical protein